jgi:hypothetical protein
MSTKVKTSNLEDELVTEEKLADNSVTVAKIKTQDDYGLITGVAEAEDDYGDLI